MSDKAERVAMDVLMAFCEAAIPGYKFFAMPEKQRGLQKAAAILREEYPDEPTLDQLAKAQGVGPIEDMGTLVIPGLEDDPPIAPAPDVSALRNALYSAYWKGSADSLVTQATDESAKESVEELLTLLRSEPKLGGTV